MRKYISLTFMSLATAFLFSAALFAQEKTEVNVQVKKNGKVVKDTTYQFEDVKEAKHALKMVEIMSGSEKHKEGFHYNYSTAHTGEEHSKAMVFISEDGETEVKQKKIKVVVSGDEEGNWTAVSAGGKDLDEEENVFIISEEDDVKVKFREILEETGNGEEVKVIVIKKGKK